MAGIPVDVLSFKQLMDCRKGHGEYIILQAADAWRYIPKGNLTRNVVSTFSGGG